MSTAAAGSSRVPIPRTAIAPVTGLVFAMFPQFGMATVFAGLCFFAALLNALFDTANTNDYAGA